MLIFSERFGDIDCDESATLRFPHGLLGFEDETSFVVVPVGDDGIYNWLQSVKNPGLAFLTTTPHFFFSDYVPEVDDADLVDLELLNENETHLLCLVTIGEDSISANLLGPIVVNTRTRMARQVVLSENRWTTREPLSVN